MKALKRFCTVVVLSVSAMMISATTQAEQMKKLGNWHVHYIAFGSTFITPEIAKTYGITRSKYKAIINISVLNADKNSKATQVAIRGKARNLIGNEQQLKFKEIIEGDSIYYIAQIDYSNEERFKFEITMQHGNREETLKFAEQFYVD